MSVKYRVTKRGYVVFSLTGVIVLALSIIGIMQLNASPQTAIKDKDALQAVTEQPLDHATPTEQTPVTNQKESTTPPEVVQTDVAQEPVAKASPEMRAADLKKTSARIFFEPDKFLLESTYYTQLDALIAVAQKYEDVKIVVEGNYNGYPGKKVSEFWTKLANDRAEVVMAYLVAKGLPADSISIVNNGCNKMINENDSLTELVKNRRVDVFLK